MNGLAFIFINFAQAARLGHVGWGFSLDSSFERFYFGSTDHLWKHPWWDLVGWMKYAHLEPTKDNDWWYSIGSYEEMLRDMHMGNHIRYHAAKQLEVDMADPDCAFKAAESMRDAGWSLIENTCVHQTHKVLSDFGARLPHPGVPATNRIPRQWFSAIGGTYLDLETLMDEHRRS